MKVSVRMEDTYFSTVLDLLTDSVEMISMPFEKEGERKRKKRGRGRGREKDRRRQERGMEGRREIERVRVYM